MAPTQLPTSNQLSKNKSWTMKDTGRHSALWNMDYDRDLLYAFDQELLTAPEGRFFQWEKPVVTYGYLLDEQKVQEWARGKTQNPIVRRPTGGGAVNHSQHELNISLIWPRHLGIFSENPRDCYQQIHSLILNSMPSMYTQSINLHTKSDVCISEETASTGQRRFSACFEEPVCNDLMIGEKKIAGGALRVTKKALLYQGSLRLMVGFDEPQFKQTFKNLLKASSPTL